MACGAALLSKVVDRDWTLPTGSTHKDTFGLSLHGICTVMHLLHQVTMPAEAGASHTYTTGLVVGLVHALAQCAGWP